MNIHGCRALTAAGFLMALTTISCHREHSAEGSLYSCDSFTVYPDSLVSDSLTIAPRGTLGMAVIRGDISVFHPLHQPDASRLSIQSGDTLIVDLFNDYADRQPVTAATMADMALWGLPADPSLVTEFVKHKPIEESWPVVSSWADRCIALDQLYLATGDDKYRVERDRIAHSCMDRDRKYLQDNATGLFRGTDPTVSDAGILPRWMNEADRYALCTYRSNVERLICTGFIPGTNAIRDSLADAIDTYLWIPDMNAYSLSLYGYPSDIQARIIDIASQSMAVGYGVVTAPMAEALVAHAPVLAEKVPRYYPSYRGGASDMTLFCIAAARVGNDKAFSAALGQLVYATASRRLSPVYLRGALLRGLTGISYTPEGMTFTPFVPSSLDGEMRFSNVRYRDAMLDIVITGNGDVVSTFTVDGAIRPDCMVPADISGHHEVAITLVGSSGARSEVNIVDPANIPDSPSVDWIAPRKAKIDNHDSGTTLLYLDGEFIGEYDSEEYELHESAPVSLINFVSANDKRHIGFSAPTHIYIPHTDSISVEVSGLTRTGARSLKDKELSRRYVESTRYKNARIGFDFDAPNDGDYYVQIVYFNGLGIVNPFRHYALRGLSANGNPAGLFVLPQLAPDSWRPDVDWQAQRGVSLPVQIRLRKGYNRLSIDYFDPGTPDFDHDANTLIPERIIITRLNNQHFH